MCGVSFVWHDDPAIDPLRVAARMAAAQSHRGPDAQRVIAAGRAALGHDRLRVLDLSERADQPFRAAGRSELLSYNGEIYNHRPLRDELRAAGVAFATTSDTEVLYHALCLFGPDALAKLQGMFAFAFFRPETGELLLARDRLGIKPLHVAEGPGFFLAASEAKGIVASGLLDVALDPEAVFQVFRFNHTLGERTALRGVSSLPPGGFLHWKLPSRERRAARYWELRFRPGGPRRFEERAEELDARFRAAVRSHLDADVPVACYLSAGIDSSGIASEAAEILGDRLTTYSMVFPGAPHSEEAEIEQLAREKGLRNVKIPIEGISFADLVHYVRSAEMPQWWTTDLALQKLAGAVAERGHRVVLAGEGPDELLAGYDAYRVMALRRTLERLGVARLARVGALRRLATSFLLPFTSIDPSVTLFYFDRHAPERREALVEGYGFYPENVAMWDMLAENRGDLLAPALAERRGEFLEREQAFFRRELGPRTAGLPVLEQNLTFESAVRLPSWVLHMGDRASASHGLELRLPYLDDGVIEALLALPAEDRLHGHRDKYILRRIHERRLPRRVCRRPKQALYTPVLPWLRPHLGREALEPYWSRERFEAVGLFDFEACERLRERLARGELRNELDRMSAEWSFMAALTTHVLDVEMRAIARQGS